jgi:hypothetical protein
LVISKEKIKEKNEKGRNLEDIYFMVFMFVTPPPLIRKKEGENERTPKEKGEMSKKIVINYLHLIFCCLLLHIFLNFLRGKENENKRSTDS